MDLRDTIKRTYIQIIEIRGGKEGERKAESLLKDIMAETSQN